MKVVVASRVGTKSATLVVGWLSSLDRQAGAEGTSNLHASHNGVGVPDRESSPEDWKQGHSVRSKCGRW
jgi:hypothetical protein